MAWFISVKSTVFEYLIDTDKVDAHVKIFKKKKLIQYSGTFTPSSRFREYA